MYPYYYSGQMQRTAQVRKEVNEIQVAGEGRVSTEPNIAHIVIGVLTEGKNLQEAQRKNSQTSNEVIRSLLNAGVQEKNIRTTEYRIDNMYDYKDGQQIWRGYEVRHLLDIKVEDITKIGTTVDAAVEAGANIVYNIRFEVDNRSELYQRALTEAIHDAQRKARTIGQTLGIQVNPIPFSVVEAETGVQPIPRQTFVTEQVAGISTPIQPGIMEVEAKIIAKFAY